MKVFVANVTTYSIDRYTFVYAKKPTRKKVVRQVWDEEGRAAALKWYDDTTRVVITEEEVIE